ncbi:MAG: 6-bladed beta-propeller, partial [Gemmatimonadota bacterium]
MIRSVPAALVPLMLVTAGCEAGARPGAVAVDTLHGGRVVVSSPAPAPGDAPAWRLVEELRLGQSTGTGPDIFGNIMAVETDRQGRIYIADNHAHEIRFFDAAGRFLRTVGGQGEGPGEFNLISGVLWHPDGMLWVMDPRNFRLTALSGSGDFLGGHRRELGFYYTTIPWAGQFDSLGRLYDREQASRERQDDRKIIVRYASLHPDRTLQPLDSLAIPGVDIERSEYVTEREGIRMLSSVPFTPGQFTAIAPNGDVWLAHTGDYRLHRVAFDGDTLRTVELRQPSPRVSDAERDSIAAETGLDPDRIPDVKPPIRHFTTDDRGRLWVELRR